MIHSVRWFGGLRGADRLDIELHFNRAGTLESQGDRHPFALLQRPGKPYEHQMI